MTLVFPSFTDDSILFTYQRYIISDKNYYFGCKSYIKMDSQKVDMYLMSHAKYFESHQIGLVRDMLINADDSRMLHVQSISLKDPTTTIIVSLLAGSLGIDRFMLGDTGMGIGKLLTCGGLGIWTIVDWFMVMGRAREINFQSISRALM